MAVAKVETARKMINSLVEDGVVCDPSRSFHFYGIFHIFPSRRKTFENSEVY